MSAWPGKTVIGLTGNIATGKSVVRKMLEHLGAFTIDADFLAHRAIARGEPGYQPVVEFFGESILDPDDQIDRARLACLVFVDTEALTNLENILHPLVGIAIDRLIRQAQQPVIVVEAIKLIEAGLAQKCDQIWVTYAPEDLQLARLIQHRGMDETRALQRIQAQPPQESKNAMADVLVQNSSSIADTWRQVMAHWPDSMPLVEHHLVRIPVQISPGLILQRAWPPDTNQVTELLNHLSNRQRQLTPEDVMDSFARQAYLILERNQIPIGICDWNIDKFVACADEILFTESIPLETLLPAMILGMEKLAHETQCEVMVLCIQNGNSHWQAIVNQMGYQSPASYDPVMCSWKGISTASLTGTGTFFVKRLKRPKSIFAPLELKGVVARG